MAGFSEEQIKKLSAPLSQQHVKTRSQAGRTFSYIEGWRAIDEANRIFGFDAWDRETVEIKCVAEAEAKIGPRTDRQGNPIAQKDGWRVAYICKVRITARAGDRAVVREGCGYGSGIDQDLGQAHESALKEAETDAMKRGLMTFGYPFGLALYDKDQANVEAPERPTTRDATNGRTRHQTPATTAADETKRQEALDAYHRITKAIEAAKLPKVIDETIAINANDLAKIKTISADTYERMMTLANARKTEMLSAA